MFLIEPYALSSTVIDVSKLKLFILDTTGAKRSDGYGEQLIIAALPRIGDGKTPVPVGEESMALIGSQVLIIE